MQNNAQENLRELFCMIKMRYSSMIFYKIFFSKNLLKKKHSYISDNFVILVNRPKYFMENFNRRKVLLITKPASNNFKVVNKSLKNPVFFLRSTSCAVLFFIYFIIESRRTIE